MDLVSKEESVSGAGQMARATNPTKHSGSSSHVFVITRDSAE